MQLGGDAEREDPLRVGVPEIHVGRESDMVGAELVNDDRVDGIVERELLIGGVPAGAPKVESADPIENTLNAIVEQPAPDMLHRWSVLGCLEEENSIRPPLLHVQYREPSTSSG